MKHQVQNYWAQFLNTTHRPPDTKCFEVFYFGHNERTATNLLALVLQGVKQATDSCSYQYELADSAYPQVGDFSIVTDFAGKPHCIIETKAVTRLKFHEVTYDLCRREGEDDSLASWQQNHMAFFTAIGKELGFEFSTDMEVIFEDFEVVYR